MKRQWVGDKKHDSVIYVKIACGFSRRRLFIVYLRKLPYILCKYGLDVLKNAVNSGIICIQSAEVLSE